MLLAQQSHRVTGLNDCTYGRFPRIDLRSKVFGTPCRGLCRAKRCFEIIPATEIESRASFCPEPVSRNVRASREYAKGTFTRVA